MHVIKTKSVYQKMELLRNKSLLAYADDTMLIGRSSAKIITKTADLITVAKSMGLEINQD